MDIKAAGLKWTELHGDSVFAEREARMHEARVRTGFMLLAAGEGGGPSATVIKAAEEQRKYADKYDTIEAAFLQAFFGEVCT